MREPIRLPVKRMSRAFPGDIDPEIESLVLTLNRYGYRTWWSCAGDAEPAAKINSANLSFKLDQEDIAIIKELVRDFTDIPFKLLISRDGRGFSIVFQRPLGDLPKFFFEAPKGLPGWVPEVVEGEGTDEELFREWEKSKEEGYWD